MGSVVQHVTMILCKQECKSDKITAVYCMKERLFSLFILRCTSYFNFTFWSYAYFFGGEWVGSVPFVSNA